MANVAKILGWTLLGAVIVHLADKSSGTSSVITSLTGGWAKIISAVTGGGGGSGAAGGGGAPSNR